MGKRLRARLFACWYFAIAAGFLLLDIKGWMMGERTWLIICDSPSRWALSLWIGDLEIE